MKMIWIQRDTNRFTTIGKSLIPKSKSIKSYQTKGLKITYEISTYHLMGSLKMLHRFLLVDRIEYDL